MAMRDKLLASPEFVKWVEVKLTLLVPQKRHLLMNVLKETTSRHPEFGNTSLDNLLILPLQRICRYCLLLKVISNYSWSLNPILPSYKELQKHTPLDMPDYNDLTEADEAISSVIDRYTCYF